MPDSDPISLEGPVELVGGELAIRIPMDASGEVLAPFARGLATIEDGYLKVVIRPWMADKLRISEASLVIVDNADGKFNITRSAANDAREAWE